MDWETWLRNAAKRPSDHEDSKRNTTEQQIRSALNEYQPLRDHPDWTVYAKGSYANNTNVRLNYDVDIAVEYNGFFYYDMSFGFEGMDKSVANVIATTDTYTRAEFKQDVLSALHNEFGKSSVTPGRIAYRVREGQTTLPADVVPCWEYRRYDGFDDYGNMIMNVGSRVYPSDGPYKNNFPEQQLERGTAKNALTSKRYKRMVRCLKKMQTKLVADGVLSKELPSYLIECIVFNVLDDRFGNDAYLDDFRSVVSSIWSGTKDDGNWYDWEEVNGLKYLFRIGEFDRLAVHNMVDKAWDAVGVA